VEGNVAGGCKRRTKKSQKRSHLRTVQRGEFCALGREGTYCDRETGSAGFLFTVSEHHQRGGGEGRTAAAAGGAVSEVSEIRTKVLTRRRVEYDHCTALTDFIDRRRTP
jgi:hypothetical protein